MPAPIAGLHHITAITGAAQTAIDFYAGILGMRLVKTTVNFDDPSTHHLYFGDMQGSPGTLLTLFPWPRSMPGQIGLGTPAPVAFVIHPDALMFWRTRLSELGYTPVSTHRFGTSVIRFQAHDMLSLALVPAAEGTSTPWSPGSIFNDAVVLQGLHSITLPTPDLDATTSFFTDTFGWTVTDEQGALRRLKAPANRSLQSPRNEPGRYIDLSARTPPGDGRNGYGTVHHVAFRVATSAMQRTWQDHLRSMGLDVSDVRDRTYFKSIYFRDRTRTGGVLFEIATDEPGFTVDEPLQQLGSTLQLPPDLEERRPELESVLPGLDRTVVDHPPLADPDVNPHTA